jgi:molecular chaperone GrpE
MPNRRYEDPEFAEAAATDPNAGDETAAEQAEAAAPAEAPGDEALAALAVLEKERDTLKEQLLRAVADFDNYRKRIERERRELSDYAATDVLLELLPIIDNFERALQAPAGGDEAFKKADEAFKKGVELIHKQMLDLLRKRGVTLIDALGADFDPNVHQAVIHEPSDEHREGEVMQELQRGYKLGDRLLRPAMVKVAKRS